mmetsp:Transcript_8576/g.23159  ORF Transcript_8576/g.23159 Transcript_8576/m.23159 type:complete len:293 (+) Transcript_8576:126-1004(+)
MQYYDCSLATCADTEWRMINSQLDFCLGYVRYTLLLFLSIHLSHTRIHTRIYARYNHAHNKLRSQCTGSTGRTTAPAAIAAPAGSAVEETARGSCGFASAAGSSSSRCRRQARGAAKATTTASTTGSCSAGSIAKTATTAAATTTEATAAAASIRGTATATTATGEGRGSKQAQWNWCCARCKQCGSSQCCCWTRGTCVQPWRSWSGNQPDSNPGNGWCDRQRTGTRRRIELRRYSGGRGCSCDAVLVVPESTERVVRYDANGFGFGTRPPLHPAESLRHALELPGCSFQHL